MNPNTACNINNLFLLYSFNRKAAFQQKKDFFGRFYSYFLFALFYSQIGENKKKDSYSKKRFLFARGNLFSESFSHFPIRIPATTKKKIFIRFLFARVEKSKMILQEKKDSYSISIRTSKKVQNDTPGAVFH